MGILEFEVKGRRFVHTAKPWRLAVNRHTTCRGNVWGWIEGPASANETWSNDPGEFSRADAAEAVRIHNEWLNAQTPPAIRLAKLEPQATRLAKEIATTESRLDSLRRELAQVELTMAEAREQL